MRFFIRSKFNLIGAAKFFIFLFCFRVFQLSKLFLDIYSYFTEIIFLIYNKHWKIEKETFRAYKMEAKR